MARLKTPERKSVLSHTDHIAFTLTHHLGFERARSTCLANRWTEVLRAIERQQHEERASRTRPTAH